MSLMTDFLNLILPAAGEPGWGEWYRNNFSKLNTEAKRVAGKVDARLKDNGGIDLGGIERTTWPAAGGATAGLNDVLANGAVGSLPAGATKFEVQDSLGNLLLSVDKATGKITSNAGSLMLSADVNPKQNRLGIHVTAASSAATGFTSAHNAAAHNMGTGNFGYHGLDVALPDNTPAADVIFLHKHDGVATGLIWGVRTNGKIFLTINATTYESTVALGVEDYTAASHSFMVQRETASTAGVIRFAVNGEQKGADVAIPAGAPATVSNTATLYLMGSSTKREACTLYSGGGFYNRFLSMTEEHLRHLNGVASADKGAFNTVLNVSTCVNGTFDTFTGASASRFSATSTSASLKGCGTADEISFVSGKNYTVEFTVDTLTGGDCFFQAAAALGSGAVDPTATKVVLGKNVRTFTAAQSTVGLIWFYTSAIAGLSTSGITVRETGSTVELSSIQINQVHDLGASDAHLNFPASGATLSGFKESGTHSWTVPISADTTLTNIVPAGYKLRETTFRNASLGPLSVRIGTTNGGTDVLSLTALNTSATFNGLKTVTINQAFNMAGAQTLYITSPDWTGGGTPPVLTATLVYDKVS